MEKKHPLGTQQNFELAQWLLDPKLIDGALRSAIHAHGPITLGIRKMYVCEQDAQGNWSIVELNTCSTSSASKRIRGAIKTRLAEYLRKKELDKQRKPWYTSIVRLIRQS